MFCIQKDNASYGVEADKDKAINKARIWKAVVVPCITRTTCVDCDKWKKGTVSKEGVKRTHKKRNAREVITSEE